MSEKQLAEPDSKTGKTGKDYFSQEKLESFERDGYVIVQGMYSQEEVNEISDWIDELTGREPVVGKQMAYFEDSLTEEDTRVLSRIEKFVEFAPELQSVVYDKKMVGRAAELLGEAPLLFKEKINFKMPGGGGFEPHQDIQPGWDDYAPYYISILLTVDPSTLENGCIELAAGHHKNGMIGEKWKPLEADQLAEIEFSSFPTNPGDVVFFDCFVPHQSAPNLTNRRRRNIYLTFNRESDGDHRDHYFADKRNSYPPDFEREPGKEYKFRV